MAGRPETGGAAGAGPAAPSGGAEWRSLPNLLTFARVALSPLFVWTLLQGRRDLALATLAVAGATDVFDGLAARLMRRRTSLGLWLDPAADKLLLTTAFVTLAIPSLAAPNAIPWAMVFVVVGRDVAIALGALIITLMRGRTRFPPTLLGKTSTVLQVLTVLAVTALNAFGAEAPEALSWAYELTAVAAGLSFLQYLKVGLAKLLRPRRVETQP